MIVHLRSLSTQESAQATPNKSNKCPEHIIVRAKRMPVLLLDPMPFFFDKRMVESYFE